MADTLTPLLSFIGWSYLPNLGTSLLQNLYYRLTIRAGAPHPQPGNPIYVRDHQRIRILVLTLYLLYTLAQSLHDITLAGDFYTLLSVDPYRTSDKEIKSRVRRLAARYHPDKLGNAESNTSGRDEGTFLQLRLASETLTTPSHRYAYTHFGPSILAHLPRPHDEDSPLKSSTSNQTLQTAQLVTLALRQKVPSYLLNLAFLYIYNTFFLSSSRFRSTGKFWRYYLVIVSFALELYLLTHELPALPGVLDSTLSFLRDHTRFGALLLPPHLLPFQVLKVLGTLTLSLNVFISQVSVLCTPSPGFSAASSSGLVAAAEHNTFLQSLNGSLSGLKSVAGRVDQEAQDLLELSLAPFKGSNGEVVGELRRGMREGMVTGVVRGHPEVREVVERARARRREKRNGLRQRKGQAQGQGQVREDGADVVDLLGSDETFV